MNSQGAVLLQFIEVRIGEYSAEDNIDRFEDICESRESADLSATRTRCC